MFIPAAACRRSPRRAAPLAVAVLLVMLANTLLPLSLVPGAALAASCPSPGFAAPASFAAGFRPTDTATGDFNADGKLDLAVTSNSGTLAILLANGAGSFGAPAIVTLGGLPSDVAVGDLNGDGKADLAVTNQLRDNVAILLGNGTGGFGPPATVSSGFDPDPTRDADLQPVVVIMGDFNTDGKADLVVANLFNRVVFLPGDGTGSFGSRVVQDTISNPGALAAGDFDGDGRPEIAVYGIADSEVRLLEINLGNTISTGVPVAASGMLDLVAADVDRDGNLDLVGHAGFDDQVGVMLGKGKVYSPAKPFEPMVSFPSGGHVATDVAVADYNGDSNPDLAVSHRATNNVGVLLGTGTGGFGAPTLVAAGNGAEAVATGDFTADGSQDLVLATAHADAVALLRNTCPIGAIDLHPTAVEVTQAIQSLNNSVVLVEGKRTFVRVHVATTVNVSRVSARLHGFTAAGAALGRPLWPLNPGAVIDLSTTPDRGRLDDSFYFELSPEWTVAGTLTLKAEINPHKVPNETSYANNELATTVTFQPTRAFKVRLVQYEYYDTAGKLHKPFDGELDAVESRLRREYPVGRLVVSRTTFRDEGHRFGTTIEFPADLQIMISRLKWFRQTYEPTNTGVIYLAVADHRAGGIAEDIPGWNAVTAAGDNPETAAHEIGHLLGRSHAQCTSRTDDEAGPDPLYPYPGGKIGGPTTDPTRFYGFDAGDLSLRIPALRRVVLPTTGDTMSYCDERWLSDYNYTKFRDRIQTVFSATDPVGDLLSVYGTLDVAAQTVSHLVLSRQGQVSETPSRVSGPYHIRLFDGAGRQVADYPFTPTSVHADGVATATSQSIAEVVEFVPGARRLAITSDLTGGELASVPISATPPTVALTAPADGASLPASGPVTVAWSGADADGDPLTATILYSPDSGTTWQTLASGVSGSAFTLDAAQVPGAAQGSGRVRVVVSDGVLTAAATSGPLSVVGKAPIVRIASPLAGATIVYGQAVTLEGIATDLEDGTLDDAQLSWASDRDGPLGTGHLVQAPLLSIGTHQLTVTATDSAGQQAAASIVVQVGARLGVGHPPVANAGPDQSAPEGTAVQLNGTGSTDPDGDPLTYAWSVVSRTGPEVTLLPPPATPSFLATDNGTYTVQLAVTDGKHGTDEDDLIVTIVNVPPVLSTADLSLSATSIVENDTVTLTGSFSDPGMGDTHIVTIAWGDGTTTTLTPAQGVRSFSATHQYRDDNPSGTPTDAYTISVTVADDDGGSAAASTSVQVANVAPTITGVSGPAGPLALGTAATVTAAIADVGSQDTHTCTFAWDDGTTTAGVAATGGACTGTRTYTAAGVYSVGITVTDDDTGAATTKFEYVVVYDPSAGFVTGGGWLASPAGAYAADPTLAGRANFGFVARYQKGTTTPTGQTEFQFKVGNFTFQSEAYQWLVVAGAKAQYKGVGMVNGVSGYSFLLTATDGQQAGGGGVDKVRIKIWETASGALVYDNVAGGSDDIDAANPQAIAGGSIVIHSGSGR